MTYIAKRARVRMAPRRKSGMGGWIDDLAQQAGISPSENSVCLDQANAAAAPIEAKVDDLDRNWNPTGFYTVADLRQVVSSTLSVVQQGYAALTQAATQVQSDSLNEANAELSKAGNSIDYLNAARDAEAKGISTINAPGLKRWAVSTLRSAADAIVAGAMVTCLEPWWLSALSSFQTAFDVAWGVIKQIAGAVLKVGEVVLKVPDLLDDVVTYAKWALLLGGALFMFSELNKAHGRHESGL